MDKIVFQFGSFAVQWYGVMVALGFLAGLWTASRRGLRYGFKPELILDLGPILLLSAIIGARTLYVISYYQEVFAAKPWWEIFMVQHGGLVYYGGLIGSSLALILYSAWKKLPLWNLSDVLAPSIALGQAFGRIGCLLNGCCYGRACSLPWAIHFPPGHETHGVGVHPTQMYESLLTFALFLGLCWLYRRRKFHGQVFATYLVGYAIARSTVEFFRGDYPVHYLGNWATPAHLVSVGILVVGMMLFQFLPRLQARTVRS